MRTLRKALSVVFLTVTLVGLQTESLLANPGQFAEEYGCTYNPIGTYEWEAYNCDDPYDDECYSGNYPELCWDGYSTCVNYCGAHIYVSEFNCSLCYVYCRCTLAGR